MSGDSRIEELESGIAKLRAELLFKEEELRTLKSAQAGTVSSYSSYFTTNEITRYSRQMLVPDISVAGQLALKKGKVLVVGIGGLGCPCSLYLAAAGIGEIHLVDNDVVDESNLHRQILHNEYGIGVSKVISAAENLKRINGNIKIIPVEMHAKSATLPKLISDNRYDVVIDGSDNVATRYLLNDVCVLNRVPLVSGSALQLEGQLTVYNCRGGPCYRCLFPEPPPPETVTSCGDGGVLGPIPGVIGVLEALETIKILTRQEGVLSGRLLTFDGSETTFRNIQLRHRNPKCQICGVNPTIKSIIDYEQFCGTKADDKVHNISILTPEEHVKIQEVCLSEDKLLIDVRQPIEFEMCHLKRAVNVPYAGLVGFNSEIHLQKVRELLQNYEDKYVFVICRRGNDSQRTINLLKEKCSDLGVMFLNVKGGLYAYARDIDPSFPIY